MITTQYYDEFLHYANMAEIQQRECNLGPIPHINGSVKDPLMQNVKLYDVVERKYAGFSQIVLDVMYGDGKRHPYYGNMNTVRTPIAKSFKGWWNKADLATKFWVLLVHRLTGSAINYSQFPSGYHNTVLPEFAKHEPNMYGLAKVFLHYDKPKFTSIGYQFPAFPKPDLKYRLGGEYFICTYLLDLCEHLAEWLESGKKRDLREVGSSGTKTVDCEHSSSSTQLSYQTWQTSFHSTSTNSRHFTTVQMLLSVYSIL
jgi:hypothetical protein